MGWWHEQNGSITRGTTAWVSFGLGAWVNLELWAAWVRGLNRRLEAWVSLGLQWSRSASGPVMLSFSGPMMLRPATVRQRGERSKVRV